MKAHEDRLQQGSGETTDQGAVIECDQCGLKQSEWNLPLVVGASCPRHYLDDDSCDGTIHQVGCSSVVPERSEISATLPSEAPKEENDSGAALLPVDPSASQSGTVALTKCQNMKTCTEPCEDVDGLDYCLKCGLWKGAR